MILGSSITVFYAVVVKNRRGTVKELSKRSKFTVTRFNKYKIFYDHPFLELKWSESIVPRIAITRVVILEDEYPTMNFMLRSAAKFERLMGVSSFSFTHSRKRIAPQIFEAIFSTKILIVFGTIGFESD